MKITDSKKSFSFRNKNFQLFRDNNGVIQIDAPNKMVLAYAQGLAHAIDRGMQMNLLRIITQGRLSECLKSDAETNAIDYFMRDVGFARAAKQELTKLKEAPLEFLNAYCEGVNYFFDNNNGPFEFKLVGYKIEKWKPEDSLATLKIMGYIGLAQTQQDMQKFMIQSIKADVSPEIIKNLFSPHLDEMDENIIKHIKNLNISFPTIPDEIKFAAGIPTIKASNNWVVSGEKSESGSPIQCNDPHLELNRLPGIWYETVATIKDDYYSGVTMPGIPGFVMGKNKYLSFGFTYGFMDMIDFFIEEIKDGKYKQGENWVELTTKREEIKTKGKSNPSLFLTIYQTPRGTIELEHDKKLEDGFYLSRAWSALDNGAAESIESLYNFLECKDVKSAQEVSRNVCISCNWLFADIKGNIGYQQSGVLPKRKGSGIMPLEGWNPENEWEGLVSTENFSTSYNPKEQFLATANNDLNQKGRPIGINLPMGDYRVRRIEELLKSKEKHSISDMKNYQSDLLSLQAKEIMNWVSPHLQKNKIGEILESWDFCYDTKSVGAKIFEDLYQQLLEDLFSPIFGNEVWNDLIKETTVLIDFYHLFDRVLYEEDKLWFGDKTRSELISKSLENLAKKPSLKICSWGEVRQLNMSQIFFDGKLPKFLGFDYGPIALPGSRATIVQGQIYKAHGRTSSFAPSWRMVADLNKHAIETVLAGGPSDRRFSKWYTSDMPNWLNFRYKTLMPH